MRRNRDTRERATKNTSNTGNIHTAATTTGSGNGNSESTGNLISGRRRRQPDHRREESREEVDDVCQICLSKRDNTSAPEPCLHKFCHNCIIRWSQQSNKCPICRRDFTILRINFRPDGTYERFNVPPPVRPVHSLLDDIQQDPILSYILQQQVFHPGRFIVVRSGNTIMTIRGPQSDWRPLFLNGPDVLADREINGILRQQLNPLDPNLLFEEILFERRPPSQRPIDDRAGNPDNIIPPTHGDRDDNSDETPHPPHPVRRRRRRRPDLDDSLGDV